MEMDVVAKEGVDSFQSERDGTDGAHVVGDVVAGLAVAAGEGVDEVAIFVAQRDGDAVDLGFDGDGDVIAAEVFAEALIELDEFVFGTGGCGFFQGIGAQLEDIVDA